MSLVKHERCSKCKKVLNISSLEENEIDSNTEIENRETI